MKRLALACALIFAISTTAEAAWVVARSNGPVWIGTSGAQKVSLSSKEELQDGATITTGAGARVLLTRNKEVMTIGPNAVVTIPADNMSGFTTIKQYAGVVEFDVEKRNVRHFAVETPFLAAVVKGTHFIVRVNRDGAKVSVSRGLVGVANSNGQHTDIAPGQSAQVVRGSSEMVVTGKPNVKPVVGLDALPSGKKLKPDATDEEHGNSGKSGKGSSESSSASGSGGNGGGTGNGNSGNGNSGNGNGNSGNGNGNSGNGNSGSGNSGNGNGSGNSGQGGG